MNNAKGLSVLAGWCLAGVALAQTPPATPPSGATPAPPGAPASALPGTPDQANPATYPSARAPDSHISNGMNVQSRSGQQVGTIVNIVADASGRPGYVVIAEASGATTAIPYPQARQMVRGTRIVVDEKRLRAAPKVPQTRLLNPQDTGWQQEADRYWKQGGTHDRG